MAARSRALRSRSCRFRAIASAMRSAEPSADTPGPGGALTAATAAARARVGPRGSAASVATAAAVSSTATSATADASTAAAGGGAAGDAAGGSPAPPLPPPPAGVAAPPRAAASRALCRDRAADARFRSRRRWSITSRSDAVILRLRAAVVPARSARASWSSATSAGGRGDDLRRRVRVILRLGAGVGWAGGVGGTPAAAATGAAATAGVAVGGGAHGAGMTCPTVGAETEAANGVAGPSGGAAAAVPTLVVRACAPATGSGAWPETNDGSGSGIGGALPR